MPARLIDLRPDQRLLRLLFRLPLPLYRYGLGFVLGGRILRLAHTGRRSGLPREVALEVLRHDQTTDSFIVASAWGERADWYRNLVAQPRSEITVGRRHVPVIARRLSPYASQRELQLYALNHPVAFALGFRFVFGSLPRSEADFRALANSIPVLALDPIDAHR